MVVAFVFTVFDECFPISFILQSSIQHLLEFLKKLYVNYPKMGCTWWVGGVVVLFVPVLSQTWVGDPPWCVSTAVTICSRYTNNDKILHFKSWENESSSSDIRNIFMLPVGKETGFLATNELPLYVYSTTDKKPSLFIMQRWHTKGLFNCSLLRLL